ncbi:hypothetical protein [Candidatus Halobonum tyrrellensis]|uniref:Uncharacterized protein n=1 Tax=Candidatus Halobonum tyrrellensis G22 TaxID=1324957 RepID=V4HIJ0_9EURY|nr:hypothetical protein [Candidatus Halobonum tyrrellensis]ESP87744.1 hypothetical protein K933_12503 [Candidatus Halobonum tyrrellensis G22]
MGLFDRDTDMSDDEPSDADPDDPAFEPVEGTAPSGEERDGDGGDGGEANGFDPDRLAAVRLRDDDFNGTLKRAVDWEAGVVLYAYGNGNAGGLAAVPIGQTDFDRE